ncbi:ABC transporter permease [bacterium]|nr:MAG: ABC transporter permease [bacterium]
MTTRESTEKQILDQSENKSKFKVFVKRAKKNKAFMIGGTIIFIFLIMALIPSVLAPYDPIGKNMDLRLLPPSTSHWFGTDDLGRDILSRIIHGAQISFEYGLLAVAISMLVGSAVGVIAGYFGGKLDEVLMRLVDVVLAFPSILLAILIVAILGPKLENAMIAIGIVNAPSYARLLRSSTITIKNNEFIESSIANGASHTRIIFNHILPNCMTPIIVQATLGIGGSILEMAGLSFLGLGAQAPLPEWGAMLNNAKELIQSSPWAITFPGIAIILSVLAFNLLGDGLRDLLDPHTAKRQ